MSREDVDILVSGGGVAGLAAAAAFGSAGFTVLCVDPARPVTEEADPGADLRTTAFLQPARALLERAGLWERLARHAAPLEIMRIVDASAPGGGVRAHREFRAADISDQPFGWNLPNWLLRREMLARIEALPTVAFRAGVATEEVLGRRDGAFVRLSDGSRIRARLVVAADGRESPVREMLAISARTIRYGQKALAFAVTHPLPHENVSTEIHRQGGPFTLVPLPDRDGCPASAVVWMERGPEALRLSRLPREAFEAAMTERSAALLGPLRLAGRISVWPIISRLADRLTGERVALMGEAAHVVPPIGAQGLNMSLADLGCLLELAQAQPDTLGSAAMLRRYERRRWPEMAARVAGIDLLNRVSMAGRPVLQALRAQGIGLLHDIGPLRRFLMHAGLGAGPSAPPARLPRPPWSPPPR